MAKADVAIQTGFDKPSLPFRYLVKPTANRLEWHRHRGRVTAVATLDNVKTIYFAMSEFYTKSTGKAQQEAEQYLEGPY